jgi:undecaprenyl pyrophosphate synthase
MSRYQNFAYSHPRSHRFFHKPPSEKVHFHIDHGKKKVRYVPKAKQVIAEEGLNEEVNVIEDFQQTHDTKDTLSLEMEGIIKELIEKKLNETEVKHCALVIDTGRKER